MKKLAWIGVHLWTFSFLFLFLLSEEIEQSLLVFAPGAQLRKCIIGIRLSAGIYGGVLVRPRSRPQSGWMVSLRSIVSLIVNLPMENEIVCSSVESWMGCDISTTPIMVCDHGMKMLLNDTVPKKLTYLKTFILSCIRS